MSIVFGLLFLILGTGPVINEPVIDEPASHEKKRVPTDTVIEVTEQEAKELQKESAPEDCEYSMCDGVYKMLIEKCGENGYEAVNFERYDEEPLAYDLYGNELPRRKWATYRCVDVID